MLLKLNGCLLPERPAAGFAAILEKNFWGDMEAVTQAADVFLAQSSLPA